MTNYQKSHAGEFTFSNQELQKITWVCQIALVQPAIKTETGFDNNSFVKRNKWNKGQKKMSLQLCQYNASNQSIVQCNA